jgi:hypothetical protein
MRVGAPPIRLSKIPPHTRYRSALHHALLPSVRELHTQLNQTPGGIPRTPRPLARTSVRQAELFAEMPKYWVISDRNDGGLTYFTSDGAGDLTDFLSELFDWLIKNNRTDYPNRLSLKPSKKNCRLLPT